MANVEALYDKRGRHSVWHLRQGNVRHSESGGASKLEAEPFDERQHLETGGSGRLQDMGEWQVDGRDESAVGREVHRRIDLDARQARGLGAGEDAGKVLFETLLDRAARRPLVTPDEAACIDKVFQPCRENVCRQRRQLAAVLNHGDVGHIASPAPQRLAFVAFVKHLGQPAFGQQGFDKGRQLSGRGLAYERRTGAPRRFPTPFKAVMGQATDRLAMPGDQKIERSFVDRRLGRSRLRQQEALGAFSLTIPAVLARQRPDRIGCILGGAILLDETRGHLHAHLGSDGAGVLAAKPKGFQKALSG